MFVTGQAVQRSRSASGRLAGRALLGPEGPSPILVIEGIAYDMAAAAPIVSELVREGITDRVGGSAIGPIETLGPALLSPLDLQCVKAAGVTFAASALER